MDFRRTYRAAAVSFADLAMRLPADLDRPALGTWTLGRLLGHAAGSGLRQVPEVLATPAEKPVVDSPEAYWAAARTAPAELIAAARAESDADAERSLAALRTSSVSELVGLATAALAAVSDDDVVTTAIGGMRVSDWIPTRTLELVVHGLDLAAAAEVPFEPPLEETAVLLTRVAVAVGDGSVLVRALTGRGALPEGFSVVA